MNKKTFQFAYDAHYVLSHEPTFQEEELWIVFHGYWQLAEFFIRKFEPLVDSKRLFIAPEGTNYGYLKDFQGRVGANWMTRHERELAIANNHRYLDGLLEEILLGFEKRPEICVLGFSQGAATATRWISRWNYPVKELILWAGGFAQDLEIESAKTKFASTKMQMVLGRQDSIITEESIQKQQELLERLPNKVEIIHFEGGHHLDADLLKQLIL